MNPTLINWKINRWPNGKVTLRGTVFNHQNPRLYNGAEIHTSIVKSLVLMEDGHCLAETQNTQYILENEGPEDCLQDRSKEDEAYKQGFAAAIEMMKKSLNNL